MGETQSKNPPPEKINFKKQQLIMEKVCSIRSSHVYKLLNIYDVPIQLKLLMFYSKLLLLFCLQSLKPGLVNPALGGYKNEANIKEGESLQINQK